MGNFKNLDKLLDSFTQGTIPGCACVVMQNNEIIHESYSGYADIEKGSKINELSIFRQASTTKLFTYAIGMMLFEEGLFRFTDPIYDFLPEWKHTTKYVQIPGHGPEIVPVENPITIRDAFTMSCGLPYCMRPLDHVTDNPTVNAMSEAVRPYCKDGKIPTLRDEVRAMGSVPIMFEPGTHWLYGLGSEIVGAIVEVITGKSVRHNMKERLIDPLGLKDTATFLDEEMMGRLVTCYQITPDKKKEPMPRELDDIIKIGCAPEYSRANLNCSCRDFAVFMSMLANGGRYKGESLLGRKTIDLMRTNQLGPDQLRDFWHYNGVDILGYGYGMGVRTLMDKAPGASNGSLGAFGWSGGYGSWAEASPEDHLSIVYMHNTQGEHNELFHVKVRDVVYGCIE